MIYSDTRCALGEGALWHPERKALIWFDILGKRMYLKQGTQQRDWAFEEHASAAGWIDRDRLLVATETGLFEMNLTTGARSLLAPLEADRPETRSNDGRADPWGGFWIGTMGKDAQPKAGAFYRYYNGTVTQIMRDVTIPNALCFAPDRSRAYFADTTEQAIRMVELDAEGWPKGDSRVLVDLSTEGLNPDGMVTDAQGNLWNAQWGASRVACYDPQGRFVTAIGFGASQVTCPAFGGPDFSTLFVTSAAHDAPEGETFAGATFEALLTVEGRPEPAVSLG